MVVNLSWATGITKFWIRNAVMQIKKLMNTKGRMNRSNEIPADLMATSSKLSPRLPKVIMEESKIAKGRARGMAVTVTKLVSLRILIRSRPLPTRSSKYF